jgi:hypothetical protein
MILITKTFNKLLNKIKSVNFNDIKIEIVKHNIWLNNFKELWTLKNRKVLKWYLLHKKVRLLVLFQENNWKYLPFFIVKKETKDGHNIRKESLTELKNKLDKIFEDLENNDYEIFDLK